MEFLPFCAESAIRMNTALVRYSNYTRTCTKQHTKSLNVKAEIHVLTKTISCHDFAKQWLVATSVDSITKSARMVTA